MKRNSTARDYSLVKSFLVQSTAVHFHADVMMWRVNKKMQNQQQWVFSAFVCFPVLFTDFRNSSMYFEWAWLGLCVSTMTINIFISNSTIYALQVLGHLSPSDVPGPRWCHVGHQDPTVSILNITFYAFPRDLLTLINFVHFKGTFFNPWTTTANITKTNPQIASVFGVSLKSWKC